MQSAARVLKLRVPHKPDAPARANSRLSDPCDCAHLLPSKMVGIAEFALAGASGSAAKMRNFKTRVRHKTTDARSPKLRPRNCRLIRQQNNEPSDECLCIASKSL